MGEERQQCRSAQLGKGSASAWMRFAFTSALFCSRGLQGRREASASMGKTMSKRWLLSAAYRVWDSNSARSAVSWVCEETAFSRVRRYAADWKKSWLKYGGNLRTFRSWRTSCVWPCAVATESCASDPLIAQF